MKIYIYVKKEPEVKLVVKHKQMYKELKIIKPNNLEKDNDITLLLSDNNLL